MKCIIEGTFLILKCDVRLMSRRNLSPGYLRNGILQQRSRRAPRQPKVMSSKAELHSLPGVAASRDPETNGFIFQQTMYRITDPRVSLDFYTAVLGTFLRCPPQRIPSFLRTLLNGQHTCRHDPHHQIRL